MPFPTLTTDRLLLRQIVAEDMAFIHEGLSRPEVIRYYGVRYDSLSATQAQMDWYANLEATDTGIWWMICDGQSGKPLGAIGYNDLDKAHRKVEIGFWLLPDHWGKGFLSEAMQPVLDYAFTTRALHRIEAFVEAENGNSSRLLQKFGFQLEGRMRDCEMKDGVFISVDVFARLSDDPSGD